MILRYYETDWSVPCIENELLFVGTKEECYDYLFKRWSVDAKELENNPELYATFCDYLRHIEYSECVFEEKTIDEILEKYPDWDDTDWHHIDATKFIYNRELVEEIVDDYPLWEQILESEIQGIFDREDYA
jgi:hypothetical protein